MHPQVQLFVENFEREALLSGSYRRQLGKAELLFLEEVWGPAFQYRFDGLKAEYPLKDLKGGQRFADFVCVKNGMRLLVEIDGFTTHARDISTGDFDDHLSRQNDMILSGWLVLRFSARQVERRPQVCQRQLKQAVGHWWALTQGQYTEDGHDKWRFRKQMLVQLAIQRSGRLKPAEVAARFNVSNRTAVDWLRRFSDEGTFTSSPAEKRVSVYRLSQYVE